MLQKHEGLKKKFSFGNIVKIPIKILKKVIHIVRTISDKMQKSKEDKKLLPENINNHQAEKNFANTRQEFVDGLNYNIVHGIKNINNNGYGIENDKEREIP